MEDIEEEKSEFGYGLTYCLGLFLGHEGLVREFKQMEDRSPVLRESAGLWFNGAGDHFFGLQWEQAPTEEIKTRCKYLREQVLHFRLNPATWQDVEWAIRETKDILMEIDRVHGVSVIQGRFE